MGIFCVWGTVQEERQEVPRRMARSSRVPFLWEFERDYVQERELLCGTLHQTKKGAGAEVFHPQNKVITNLFSLAIFLSGIGL